MTETRTQEQGLRERIARLEREAENHRLIASHEQDPDQDELNAIRALLVETGNMYGTNEQAAMELFYRADADAQSLRHQLALLEAERAAAEDTPERRAGLVRERAETELSAVRDSIARLERQHGALCYMSFEPAGYSSERVEEVEAALERLRVRECRAQAALSEVERRGGSE